MAGAARFDHPAKLLLLEWPVSGPRRLGQCRRNLMKCPVPLHETFGCGGHEGRLIFRGHRLAQDEAVMNLLRQRCHARIVSRH